MVWSSDTGQSPADQGWTVSGSGMGTFYQYGASQALCPNGDFCWRFSSDKNVDRTIYIPGLSAYSDLELSWMLNAPAIPNGGRCVVFAKYGGFTQYEQLGGIYNQSGGFGIFNGNAPLQTGFDQIDIQVRVLSNNAAFECYMSNFEIYSQNGAASPTETPTRAPTITGGGSSAYYGCAATGSNSNLILNQGDVIYSSNDEHKLEMDYGGNFCLIEDYRGAHTYVWCVSDQIGTDNGGYVEMTYDGQLIYRRGDGSIAGYIHGGNGNPAPTDLCVNDCGGQAVLRDSTGTELWVKGTCNSR